MDATDADHKRGSHKYDIAGIMRVIGNHSYPRSMRIGLGGFPRVRDACRLSSFSRLSIVGTATL